MTTDPTLPAGGGKDAVRRAMRFGALASAILFAVIIVLGFASRLEVFNAGFHVGFALALGVAGTILLGVGLMPCRSIPIAPAPTTPCAEWAGMI